MDHGFITIRAIDARRAAVAHQKNIGNTLQNPSHPDVVLAARMVRSLSVMGDSQNVQINICSPLVDYLTPVSAQLNESK